MFTGAGWKAGIMVGVGERKFGKLVSFCFVSKQTVQFSEGKKETSRTSPPSLLSPSCCCQYSLSMWPSPVQILSWPLSEQDLGQGVPGRSSSSKVAGSVFWGGSVWTRVCWGWRGFVPLHTGRMQASHRPCGHANIEALGPCLHPSVLTSVGLLSLFLQVFCRNGLQSMFSIKNFPFWLCFPMKGVF